MEAYSLEGSIKEFFEQVSPTKQQCDDLAASLANGPVYPIPIQASYSYTVSSKYDNKDQKTIQFRLASSPLDMELLRLAKEIYGDFVSSTEYHGDVGDGSTALVKVYIMDKSPGVHYIETLLHDDDGNLRNPVDRTKVVQEFAKFLALGWFGRQQVPNEKLEENKQITSKKLSILASGLPSEFHSLINDLQKKLDEIYSPTYHQSLCHGDLGQLNTVFSPETGTLRVINWGEASIAPFGMELYGLEELLGSIGPGGWKYFENGRELENEFWRVFWDTVDVEKVGLKDQFQKRIQMARDLGILLSFGFRGKSMEVVAEGDPNPNPLKYLRAFLLLP